MKSKMLEKRLEDLAILGGRPAFDEPLYVGRPNIGNRGRLLSRINDSLDRRWLSNRGRFVVEFEQTLAAFLGVKHCIATCNGTIALAIAARALGMTGQVIIPSWTFVATAHALKWHGITPVFCDVDRETHNLDPKCVEELITPETTGLLPVHLWGRPCDVEALGNIAEWHGLPLLYDASHALACTKGGRFIGSFGEAEVFSLHATKFMNAFEGGVIATNDDDLAARIRVMKNFGFAGLDHVCSLGTNGKMNEISAAMALTSLESVDTFGVENRRIYQAYERGFSDLPGFSLLSFDEHEKQNYQYVVVDVEPKESGLTRDMLVTVLRSENVLARRYFYPGIHRMAPYDQLYAEAHKRLPNTEWLAARTMCLPTGTAMCEADVETIFKIIGAAISGAELISAQFNNKQESRGKAIT